MTAASRLTALLGGARLCRRWQKALRLVAAGSLVAGQAGCGPETPTSEGTESGTSEVSTGPVVSTGDGPCEASARMFGKFHDEVDYVGLTVSEPPDDLLFRYPWTTLQVERDGSLSLWNLRVPERR